MIDVANDGDDATAVDRSTTGKRILFSLFFAIVVRLLEVMLAIVVLFELAYSLITKRVPHTRVTRFANRVLGYAYDVGEYVTCNKNQPPFPFDDLPDGLESTRRRPTANI
jgi:hypothetical protein